MTAVLRKYIVLEVTVLLLVIFACTPFRMQVADDYVLHQSVVPENESMVLERIAFGSCNKHDKAQPMWQYVSRQSPDLWVWLGDNIYGDTDNMVLMKQKYDLQLKHSDYQSFIKDVPVIGIWDDHDYGSNNAGKEFPLKAESQNLHFNFLNVPRNAVQRKTPGIYSSYSFGSGDKKVKFFMLDTRSFRDNPKTGGTMLGSKQWEWLEGEMKKSDAAVNIICSSIQAIPAQHSFEKWENFPLEREMLISMIEKYELQNPIIISGDRHIGEVSRLQVADSDCVIYEVTSSGMTHSYFAHPGNEDNDHRLGKIVSKKNFGLIEIDWSSENPKINLSINGLDDVEFESYQVDN